LGAADPLKVYFVISHPPQKKKNKSKKQTNKQKTPKTPTKKYFAPLESEQFLF